MLLNMQLPEHREHRVVMASRVQCDVDNASDRTALQGVPELAWLPVCVTATHIKLNATMTSVEKIS